jgi:hypothetical protein
MKPSTILFFLLLLTFALQSRGQEILPKITPISDESYQTGGIIGTTLGFGIGHAYEGRWSGPGGDGYKFTAGEVAPFAIILAGSLFESMLDLCGGSDMDHPDCNQRSWQPVFGTRQAFDAAVGITIAFKVWEIFDLWNYPHGASKQASGGSSPEFAVVPTADNQLNFCFKVAF